MNLNESKIQFLYIHLRNSSEKNIQYKKCKENRSIFLNITYKAFRSHSFFIASLSVEGGLLEK
jgi:hypothetical protein